MRGESSANFRRHPHILVLDDLNSDRSQMAEGFLRHLASDLVEVRSAGLQNAPMDRRTAQVMEEIGIDIRRQQEKLVSRDHLLWADMIIIINDPGETLHAAVPSSAVEKRWLIARPSANMDATGLEAYRDMRDQVKKRVDGLINSMRLFYGQGQPGMGD